MIESEYVWNRSFLLGERDRSASLQSSSSPIHPKTEESCAAGIHLFENQTYGHYFVACKDYGYW